MSQQTLKFEQVFSNRQLNLSACYTPKGLLFRMAVYTNLSKKDCTVYVGKLTSLEKHKKLQEVFDSLIQIFDILQHSENFSINEKRKSLTLLNPKTKDEIFNVVLKKERTNDIMIRIESKDWVRKDCSDYDCLSFEGNKITAKNSYAYVLSSSVLKLEFTFIVHIHNISGYVGIGIADVTNSTKTFKEGHRIRYYDDGSLYETNDKIDTFKKFYKGDILTVSGNLGHGLIEFKVNNVCACTYINDKLTDTLIKWAPLIYLIEGSSVEILEISPEASLLAVFIAGYLFKWDDDLLWEMNNIICLEEECENIEE